MLIIGTVPLPIGGVSIHVERLCKALDRRNFDYRFYDFKRRGLPGALAAMPWFRACHLHFSHPYAILLAVLWSRLFGVRAFVTVHGSVSRFSGLKRSALRLALRLAHMPILLNAASHQEALPLNRRARLLSAFIPPAADEVLAADMLERIRRRSAGRKTIVITNASACAYDQAGREIYGVFGLIDHLAGQDSLLIVSDPSGMYKQAALKKYGREGLAHVLFLSVPHSFFAALKTADIFIRNTVTDGDSLSVHEALYLKKKVWATSVVSRPPGVLLYRELAEIALHDDSPGSEAVMPEVVDQLIGLYARHA